MSTIFSYDYDKFRAHFDSVTLLLADTSMSYSATGNKYRLDIGDLVNAGGHNYVVAATGASDNHIVTAGLVKMYEAGPSFASLDNFKDWVAAGYTAPDGTAFYADGTFYEAESGNTSISGLPGWKTSITQPNVESDGVSTATDVDTFNFIGDGVTVSDAGGGQVDVVIPGAGANFLMNGNMRALQYGTSETGITTGGYYTADRWRLSLNAAGTWTSEVVADTDFVPFGVTNVLKMTNTTAQASPGAGAYGIIEQGMEGLLLGSIKKGTSSAEKLTLSFVVKSNVTGTYAVGIQDLTNTRHIVKTFTIDAANTAELKTITFAADTDSGGVLAFDGSFALAVSMWFVAGTDFTSGTLPDSAWATTVSANRAVGQVNLAAATSNYISLSRLQLQVGETASAFDDTNTNVLRYYQFVGPAASLIATGAGQAARTTVPFTQMRDTPTATEISAGTEANVGGSPAPAVAVQSNYSARFTVVSAASGECYSINSVWALSSEY